jgi:hypothetical protein
VEGFAQHRKRQEIDSGSTAEQAKSWRYFVVGQRCSETDMSEVMAAGELDRHPDFTRHCSI